MSLLPHQLELLSPARDADIGIEAVNHGADAVYIGGPAFGARATAGNDIRDMERLIKHAHRFGSRIFITLNTILRDDELEGARQMAWDVYNAGADALIIQDATLLFSANVFAGLKPDGYVVINSSKTIDELGLSDLLEGRDPDRIVTVPATDIAREYIGRPLPNVVLLGALAALTGRFKVDSIAHALRRKFPEKLAGVIGGVAYWSRDRSPKLAAVSDE